MDKKTDEQLLLEMIDGNSNAVDELYNRYAKKLYLFLKHTMHNQNPEDLVHDVFIKIIESAHHYNQEKASFKTWIFTIARNKCIDLLRRDKKVKILSLDREIEQSEGNKEITVKEILVDENRSIEELVEKKSIIQAVRECINELKKDEEKQAVLLYYISGKVYREISEIFDKSISMVKKYVTSAQKQIRLCLEKKGINDLH